MDTWTSSSQRSSRLSGGPRLWSSQARGGDSAPARAAVPLAPGSAGGLASSPSAPGTLGPHGPLPVSLSLSPRGPRQSLLGTVPSRDVRPASAQGPSPRGSGEQWPPDLRAFIPDPCTAHMRRHEGLTRQLEPRLGAPECGRRPCLSAWPSWIPRGSPCSRGQREGPREKTEVHRGAARRHWLRGRRQEGRGGGECVSVGSRGRGKHRSGSVMHGGR